jgi:hypothetical protein
MCKAKAIPVTDSAGLQVRETARLPQFIQNQLTDGSEFVSITQ